MKSKTRLLRGVVALVAVWLAVVGQRRLGARDYVVDGVFFLALAVGLFLVVILKDRSESLTLWPLNGSTMQTPEQEPLVRGPWYRVLLVAMLLLSAAAFISLAKNRFTLPGALCWCGALAAWLLATVQVQPGRARWKPWDRATWTDQARRGGVVLRGNWVALLLLCILALAFFFRVYRIDALPSDPESDHVEASEDVRDILDGQYRIFMPRNTGREPTQFYLTAALARVFGFGFVTLKLTMALVGALNVIPMYFLGKELLDRRFGVLAAFLVAISYWHVIISRIGLRIVLAPLWTSVTLYFLLRAFRTGRRNDYLLTGLSLGLGLYGYQAFRIVPLLVVVLCMLKVILDRGPSFDRRRFVVNVALLVITSVLAFLPMLRYWYDDPRMFWYRALTRATPLETEIRRNQSAVFIDNVKNALLMFNWIGDDAWPESVPTRPSLDYVTGAFLILGAAYVLYLLLRKRQVIALYLLVSVFVLLLPSTLAIAFPNENPSHLRASAVIPVIILISALSAYVLATYVVRILRGGLGLLLVVVLGGLLAWQAVRLNFRTYFVDYYEHYRRSAWNATDMARVIRGFGDSLGDVHDAYLICTAYWIDGHAVSLMLKDMRWNNFIFSPNEMEPHLGEPRNRLYIFNPVNAEAELWLREHYPTGQLMRFQAFEPDKDFMVYLAPAQPTLSQE